MNETQFLIGLILVGGALMVTLLGLGVAIVMPGIDRWSKRFFTVYFLTLALYFGFSLAEMIGYLRPEMRSAMMALMYFDSLFPSALMPLMTVYLLHCCGINWPRSPLFRAEVVLWSAFFATMSMTPFTTWFYYIPPEGQMCRGPLYPLMVAFLYATVMLNLAGVIGLRNKLSHRYYCAFLAGLLPMAAAMSVHFFISVFVLLATSIVFGALSMFAIILSDLIGQYQRQQREIAHQRASTMVLQMRPHFIYNTMMTIYYLCKQNPDLAQQVTLDFTTYLRRNFNAVASDSAVPFSTELEHTRAYLAVEQAQYGDMLVVDYEIAFTHFHLPPLTLQPIVENAVKHGMDPDGEPLHISVKTRYLDPGSAIIVENNGIDFKPADDNEPHIALKNIRQRLAMMCGGRMTIQPREGGGTVVMVTIP